MMSIRILLYAAYGRPLFQWRRAGDAGFSYSLFVSVSTDLRTFTRSTISFVGR
jgi:hypothetical protein